MTKPIAIYTCYNVRYPLGGHVLAELQYIVALQRLGYEVIVVEESGTEWAPCYDPERREMTQNPAAGLRLQEQLLRQFGLERQWCYVDSDRRYHGLPPAQLRELCQQATVLFSRAGVNWLPEFAECKTRVFVDVDPGRVQFQMSSIPHGPGSCSGYASPYDFHYHFSYGERIGQPDCPVPTRGLTWRPTRPPLVLDLLPQRFTPDARYFTTVMSWSAHPPIMYDGVAYGQKDGEFQRVIELPRRVGEMFEIAITGQPPRDQIRAAGWRLADGLAITATLGSYCEYLAGSRGEFSVATNLVVKTRCGWFSDRTAAYLAFGKPAVVQDTGWPALLPQGEGLFAFQDTDGAVSALEEIQRDYGRHCRAARRVAEEFLAAERVLGNLLRQCNLPVA